MNDFDILFDKIKQLSKAVTESNYSDYSKQAYDMLIAIHDLGISKDSVYNMFFESGLRICLIIYVDGAILKNIFGKMSNYRQLLAVFF